MPSSHHNQLVTVGQAGMQVSGWPEVVFLLTGKSGHFFKTDGDVWGEARVAGVCVWLE